MIVPTTRPWPQKLIPHKLSCQSKTQKINQQNLILVWYSCVSLVEHDEEQTECGKEECYTID